MCTVSYVPLSDGFLFTCNRDEDEKRETLLPELYSIRNRSVFFAKDKKAGGTWFAFSGDGKVACLLNGAFVKHKHNPPYRKSRGLLLLDYFHHPAFASFVDTTELNGIEPFTIIAIENAGNNMYELRWDGTKPYVKQLPSSDYYLWMSSTLYGTESYKLTLSDFNKKKLSLLNTSDAIMFHHEKSYESHIGEKLFRHIPQVKTISISSLKLSGNTFDFCYKDIIAEQTHLFLKTIPF